MEVSGSSNESLVMEVGEMKGKVVGEKDQVRVKRKTLQAVLEECQRALELLSKCEDGTENDDEDDDDKGEVDPQGEVSGVGLQRDQEADGLCDLLKSRVQCSDFLEKLECAQVPVPENIAEEGSSWDMVNANDLWEDEDVDSDQEDYVLVRQEDIVEGIACFMAAYLLSLKQTKNKSCLCIFIMDSSAVDAKGVLFLSFFLSFPGFDPQSTSASTEQDLLCKKEKGKVSKSMGWK